jgi:hypothetical protein
MLWGAQVVPVREFEPADAEAAKKEAGREDKAGQPGATSAQGVWRRSASYQARRTPWNIWGMLYSQKVNT